MMKPKIVDDRQNDLMNRREVKIEVENNFVPSRIEALHIVADLFKCEIDVIKINRVDSQFGTKIFTIVADIYKSKEDKQNVALKKKKDLEIEKKFEEEKKLKEEAKESTNDQELNEESSGKEDNSEEKKE